MRSLFNKMNVAKKFILTFAIIFVATTGSMVVLFLLLNAADRQIDIFLSKSYVSVSAQLRLRDEFNSVNQSLLDMV
ncbi:MAG: hypothetical protein GX488_07720, partial [Clostridiales bacterium]|nr:hypothetical protein [Clostridiales bacterium]